MCPDKFLEVRLGFVIPRPEVHSFFYNILPTLILLAPLSWGKLLKSQAYHESFGNPALFLDLELEKAAFGTLKEKSSFEGVFASQESEEKIRGYRMKKDGYTWYVFETKKGQFIGWLMSGNKGCEPELHYQFHRSDLKQQSGVLKAAFCL